MQVTQVADRVTHAVIGGKAAESFGISDDAAFFDILSNALYRDKFRAVVRETMCNAWDAHIEAGLCEVPIEITLTDKKMIFQDFGLGISTDMIKPLYGTYGGTTKRANKNVTGGFGLGCKAPFAYVDHFEVASCHAGEKNIYRMSKSNGQVEGKPSILPIVSVPTDETGVAVTISLKDPYDRHKFEKLIRQIAALGDMKVKLNGELLKTFPFTEARNGYLLIQQESFGEGSEHCIQLRYGHVVYPIELHDSYAQLYSRAKEFMSKVSGKGPYFYSRHYNWVLVLQAQPNTISVTPSRESLSMTDHTVETIHSLLTQFIKNTKGTNLPKACFEINQELIEATSLVNRPFSLIERLTTVPNIRLVEEFCQDSAADVAQLGGHYLKTTYPDFEGFHKRDFLTRINSLIKSGFVDRGLAQSFRAAWMKSRATTSAYKKVQIAERWFASRIVAPLKLALAEEPLLEPKKLGVWASSSNYLGADAYPTEKVGFGKITDYLPLLRKVVIVAYNRTAIAERAHAFPVMKYWLGHPDKSLTYIVPRNVARAKAATAFFERQGYTVLDLTVAHPWEEAEIVAPKLKTVATPRKKGIPLLSGLTDFRKVATAYSETAERIEKPAFVVKVGPRIEHLEQFSPMFCRKTAMEAIVRLYGDRAGLVTNSAQEERYVKNGAKKMDEWLFAKLLDEYKTNPDIQKAYQNSPRLIKHLDDDYKQFNHHQIEVLKLIQDDDELRNRFRLPQSNSTVNDIITIRESIDDWHFRYHDELKEIQKLIASWTISPELGELCKLVQDNELLNVLDVQQTSYRLLLGTDAQKTKIRRVLVALLKG